ncbi:MAG: flippase-like domain-containing protein, partial [Verrucomicrobia bacterium]|nr:flippase-like domain-containing protein [Verrucomicrobiota bacterium]
FRVPKLRAIAILFVGEFFTICTPGLIGGDAMRIFYLARAAPEQKIDAGILVLMDRLVGMAALISLATGVLALRYDWLNHSTAAAAKLVHGMMGILAFGAVALLLALMVARTGALAGWGLVKKLAPVTTALHQYGKSWRLAFSAFVTTFVAHGCYYATYCCAARALAHASQPAPSFGDVFSVMPVVNTLVAMPVSLGGLGMRESLFQVLLHDLTGTPEAIGALIGMLGYAIQASWGIFGAGAFLSHQFLSKKPL